MFIRFLHISFAFLIFISSTGLVVNAHYCREELKDLALFLKAEPCHAEKAMKSCPFHDQKDQNKKDCCHDDSEYVKLELDQQVEDAQLDLPTKDNRLQTVFFPVSFELPDFDRQSLHYLHYKPPLIVCDFSISFQTFLC